MNKYEFYRKQRNKHYQLYKSAPNKVASDECMRIVHWYVGQIDKCLLWSTVLENQLFMSRFDAYLNDQIVECYQQLVELQKQRITLLEEKNELKSKHITKLSISYGALQARYEHVVELMRSLV